MKQYLVEVKCEITTSIVIDARDPKTAIERVLRHEGIPSDSVYGKPEIVAVRRLDE